MSINDSNVNFDMDGDGIKDRTAWVAAGDAMLAYDKDLNGLIEGTDEIGFKQNGAPTDLEGLRRDFDTNQNGIFSKVDEEWDKFGLWQDSNQNGITDEGEFRSLKEWGIKSLNLVADLDRGILPGRAVILGTSEYTKMDGTKGQVTDAILPIVKGTQEGASEAEIQRQAELIVQAMASATDNEGIASLFPNRREDETSSTSLSMANPLDGV